MTAFSLIVRGFVLGISVAGSAAAAGSDSLDSLRWEYLRKEFFKSAPAVTDPRVKVVAPEAAEDALNVPVAVSVDGLDNVEEVQVFADFNPIVKILQFFPQTVRPYLAFRVKLQTSTPVRAAARTSDGVWHMGGTWVSTGGGGCTVAGLSRASETWRQDLGKVQGRIFDATEHGRRVRLRILHPMDTGLVAGIPALFIERLQFADGAGKEVLRIETFEPVSENPVFTFELPAGAIPLPLTVSGTDNNGNLIRGELK